MALAASDFSLIFPPYKPLTPKNKTVNFSDPKKKTLEIESANTCVNWDFPLPDWWVCKNTQIQSHRKRFNNELREY